MSNIIKKEEVSDVVKSATISKILPSGVSPDAAFVLIQTGHELGFSPMQSLRMFHIISGKAVLSADAMHAICLASDKCEYFIPTQVTAKSATFVAKRKGAPREVEFTFTLEDAQLAGLLGNPTWKKYPKQMLSARAKSALARLMFPELLGGLYDPDEIAPGTVLENSSPKPEEKFQSQSNVLDAEFEEPAGLSALDMAAIADIGRATSLKQLDDLARMFKGQNVSKGVRQAWVAKKRDLEQEILSEPAHIDHVTEGEVV